MKPRPSNIFDVARLAAVSTATVSRALSSPGKLKPDTLRRVKDAVTKLGYVSHGIARALVSRRTYTIGAVFPSLDAIFANTTYMLQKALDERGYTLIVSCDEYDPRVELRMARNLIERGVDGLVLVGTTHEPELFALLKAFDVPYVFTWATDRAGRLPCVGFDNRRATSLITRHLVDLGHTRFGVIAGLTANNERVRERLAGVIETLARNRLSVPASRIIEAAFNLEAARDAARRMMAQRARPTALVCSNDVLAVGAMMECHAMGLSVPEEVSIGGCGNFDIASMVTPALTTVRWPTMELGKFAALHLLGTLEGKPVRQQQVFPVELLVRGSTAAARSGKRRGVDRGIGQANARAGVRP